MEFDLAEQRSEVRLNLAQLFIKALDFRINGFDDVCRRIREQSWGRKTVFIALTGWGQEEDRRKAKEAGFDHHLVKPVDPEEVQAILRGEPRPEAPGVTGSGEFRPLS